MGGDGEKQKVLVIGGGFVGLGAARHLCGDGFDVTLVDSKQFFEFAPGMCGPYVEPSYHDKLVGDYASICKTMGANYIHGHAHKLKDGKLSVREGHCEAPIERSERSKRNTASFRDVVYDYCVVCTGCQYGIQLDMCDRAVNSSACLWYPTLTRICEEDPETGEMGTGTVVKDSDPTYSLALSGAGGDDIFFDERVLADRKKHVRWEHERLQKLAVCNGHVVVVGAGPVGVEFAGEVKHHYPNMTVTLVDKREECCPPLPKSAKKHLQDVMDKMGIRCFYGFEYQEMLTDPAKQNDFFHKLGISVPDRVYMAVGLRPQSWFMPEETLTPGKRGGWIYVNENCQVLEGEKGEPIYQNNVFAAGNCTSKVPGVGVLPKNSFPGEDMAALCARNIHTMAQQNGEASLKPLKWSAGMGVTFVSVGPRAGVCVIGNREPETGYTVLKGLLVPICKEIIRWAKVDEANGGCLGTLMFKFVH